MLAEHRTVETDRRDDVFWCAERNASAPPVACVARPVQAVGRNTAGVAVACYGCGWLYGCATGSGPVVFRGTDALQEELRFCCLPRLKNKKHMGTMKVALGLRRTHLFVSETKTRAKAQGQQSGFTKQAHLRRHRRTWRRPTSKKVYPESN
ncbi:hypothetical protein BC567DRAFT_80283 [Phyllosticta citribraziliensis]